MLVLEKNITFGVSVDHHVFRLFFILTRFYPMPRNSLIVINPWQGNFRYFSNWQKLHLVPCQRWNLRSMDVSTSVKQKCKKILTIEGNFLTHVSGRLFLSIILFDSSDLRYFKGHVQSFWLQVPFLYPNWWQKL